MVETMVDVRTFLKVVTWRPKILDSTSGIEPDQIAGKTFDRR